MRADRTLVASACVFFSAGVWGLLWIPLRHVQSLGVVELWSTALFLGAPIPLAAFACWRFSHVHRAQIRSVLWLGAGCGLSVVLYATGLIIEDVIRVTYLFYLMPIWTTLISFFWLKEPISAVRWFAVVVAFAGLCLMLGIDEGLPWPRTTGDWCATAAGVLWALCLVGLRKQSGTAGLANTCSMFVFGFVIALGLAFSLAGQREMVPTSSALQSVLPIAFGVGCLAFWPTAVGMLWGATHLYPSTAALLTMSELIVATLSAGLWLGTSLTSAAKVGAICILLAAMADLWFQRRRDIDCARELAGSSRTS